MHYIGFSIVNVNATSTVVVVVVVISYSVEKFLKIFDDAICHESFPRERRLLQISKEFSKVLQIDFRVFSMRQKFSHISTELT